MAKIFPMRPYNPNRLAHAPEPDEEVARELQAKQADEALLRQWALEEKQAKAVNRHIDREVLRMVEQEVRRDRPDPRNRVIFLEPELVEAVDDVLSEAAVHRKRRAIMRRVRHWTKDALVNLEMMQGAIRWLHDFTWKSFPCMACGFDLGIGGLGDRVPYQIVIITPKLIVGGLCRKCFELDKQTKGDLIIKRLHGDARR